MLKFKLWLGMLFCVTGLLEKSAAQGTTPFRIVGYYCGSGIPIDSFETEKLSHLIFCFGSLYGNRFRINNAGDSTTIKSMVRLKSRNPQMKVMLSLGGWGGCRSCSEVFGSAEARKEFAQSVKEVSDYFKTDGIDLDWEYPAIRGFPGHAFSPADRASFTALLKELREVTGSSFEISFAAGGFTAYIDSSVEWKDITGYVNFINIMSYDLVHGFSTQSGHHTPLYSTPQQVESTDHAVELILSAGVPANKLVIGAAFYGRFFLIDEGSPVGLYMPGRFLHGFSFKYSNDSLSEKNGFEKHWDDIAKAPFAINKERRLLATYDDPKSVELKTRYAKDKKLGGIMFWQLYDDKFHHGLLETIYDNK